MLLVIAVLDGKWIAQCIDSESNFYFQDGKGNGIWHLEHPDAAGEFFKKVELKKKKRHYKHI